MSLDPRIEAVAEAVGVLHRPPPPPERRGCRNTAYGMVALIPLVLVIAAAPLVSLASQTAALVLAVASLALAVLVVALAGRGRR